jgi:DNA-binding transcriptional LysR family regulator
MPSYDIWVLVHPDLRRSPRLRVFRDEMVATLKRLQPTLAGRP